MALLNIAALAQRTGVPPDTLRKWEERYGVLRPERTRGGQRRYSELDAARVEWLRGRLAEGYRIGEAAALLGRGEGEAPNTARRLIAALREATERGDAIEIGRLVHHTLSLRRLEHALENVIEPLLEEVGNAWVSGALTPAHEHLLTQALRLRLGQLLTDPRPATRGAAVLACGPGEQHDIALVALGVLLSADGWQVAFLGGDTPAEAALAVATQTGARALCVSVTMRAALGALEADLARVRRPDGLELVVGGDAVTPRASSRLRALEVDGDLPGVVRTLRRVAR